MVAEMRVVRLKYKTNKGKVIEQVCLEMPNKKIYKPISLGYGILHAEDMAGIINVEEINPLE